MTLIGPDRDVMAVGAALKEQSVLVIMTAPGGKPRRCRVKIPQGMEKFEAATLIVKRLSNAGLLCEGDVVDVDSKEWTAHLEVEEDRRQQARGKRQEDEGRAA
jgi:hypothetical protein